MWVCNNAAVPYQPAWPADFTLHGGTTQNHKTQNSVQYADDAPRCVTDPSQYEIYVQEIGSTHDHCCGTGILDKANVINEDDENNNKMNDNEATLAILAGQTKTFHFNVYNHDTSGRTFSHSQAGLPGGWTFSFSEPATYVESEGVVFVAFTLTAPDEVGSWPDFEIHSDVAAKPLLSQFTLEHARDANSFMTTCG